MEEVSSLIKALALDKLTLTSPVLIQREWLIKENKAYVAIYQNQKFKFHLLCEANETSLNQTEELCSETLSSMGYKVSRSFSH